MLEILIKGQELWDDENEMFITVNDTSIRLEHSLVSISKWESKWHEPFLSDKDKTTDQTLDYISCMALDNVDPNFVYCLTKDDYNRIVSYIDEKMTASWINTSNNSSNTKQQITTSEVIYSMMFELGIPMECENWHFNRLIMQIQVSAERQKPPEKLNKQQLAERNKRLNEERRRKYHTKG